MDSVEERIKGIGGWLSPHEAQVLEQLARDEVVMEIGSYYGRSTVAMAAVAKKMICIDSFLFGSDLPYPRDETGRLIPPAVKSDARETFEGNVAPWRDKLEVCEMDSLEAVKLDWEPVGLLFIDGGHDYETVKSDCGFLKWVIPGGHVAFHDASWGSVGKAIREAMTDNPDWEVAENYGNMLVCKRNG